MKKAPGSWTNAANTFSALKYNIIIDVYFFPLKMQIIFGIKVAKT